MSTHFSTSNSSPSRKAAIFNFPALRLLSALLTLLMASLGTQESEGAVPQTLRYTASPGISDNVDTPASKAEALSAISGSPWPGVIDHLLQSPVSQPSSANRQAGIHINYPSLGHRNIDADIRAWVETLAATFQTHLDTEVLSSTSEIESQDNSLDPFLQDDDLNSEAAAKALAPKNDFELWGTYTISRPSDAAVSITYELWNYTNNNSGNLDILTLNYNLLNGQRLNFVDIFEKPDLALQLMSAWSRNQLSGRLGEGSRLSMLKSGTEPILDNFSSLTLTPDGVCINFQPWQVAPWAAGIQKVDMPLNELAEAEPLMALWGKTDNSAKRDKL